MKIKVDMGKPVFDPKAGKKDLNWVPILCLEYLKMINISVTLGFMI